MADTPDPGATVAIAGRRPAPGRVHGRSIPLAAWLLLAAAPAAADNLFVAPSLALRETYTDNANFGIGPVAKSDLISELIPSIALLSLSKSLHVSARFQLDGIDYLHNTLPNGVIPSGGIDATLEAIDQHLFLDAAALATQEREDVFAATPATPSTYNTFTTENYRVSPYYKGVLPGGVIYVIRSDNAWVRTQGVNAGTANSRLGLQSVNVDSVPRPLGWTVHLEADQTAYTDSTAPIVREEIGQFILKAAPDAQLVLSLIGGAEHENYLLDTRPRAIYGAGLDWRPTDRSSLEATGERRFFGAEWDYSAKYRTTQLIANLAGGRNVTTSAQEVFALPIGGDMAAMLDSILLATYPDPVERAAAVQDLLSQENLPQTLASGTTIFTTAPVLLTANKAALTWLGHRDAATLSIYDIRTQSLAGNLTTAVAAETAAEQNDQKGGALTLTHHLTPFSSVSAVGQISKIEGVGATSGVYTRQNALTVQLNHSFSRRTDAYLGARLQSIESNITADAREKAALAGVSHRF